MLNIPGPMGPMHCVGPYELHNNSNKKAGTACNILYYLNSCKFLL